MIVKHLAHQVQKAVKARPHKPRAHGNGDVSEWSSTLQRGMFVKARQWTTYQIKSRTAHTKEWRPQPNSMQLVASLLAATRNSHETPKRTTGNDERNSQEMVSRSGCNVVNIS